MNTGFWGTTAELSATPHDKELYAMSISFDQAVVASYLNHNDAEEAVRRLSAGGLPMGKISIIGRDFQVHEDVQGFYHPGDAALDGAKTGGWFGGIFGLMMGAMGFFVFPVAGAVIILGPLAGLVAGAIGGAGVGALTSALIDSGVPEDHALKYEKRLQAGEFVVVVHGTAEDAALAHTILQGTSQTSIQTHSA